LPAEDDPGQWGPDEEQHHRCEDSDDRNEHGGAPSSRRTPHRFSPGLPHILGKLEKRTAQICSSLLGRTKQRIGPGTGRLGCRGGEPLKGIARPHSCSVQPENLRQFRDNLALASSHYLLNGMNDPTTGPDPHRQQLIHRVNLDPHQVLTTSNGPIDGAPLPSSADDGRQETEDQGARRGEVERNGKSDGAGNVSDTDLQLLDPEGFDCLVPIDTRIKPCLPQAKACACPSVPIDQLADASRQRGQSEPNQQFESGTDRHLRIDR